MNRRTLGAALALIVTGCTGRDDDLGHVAQPLAWDGAARWIAPGPPRDTLIPYGYLRAAATPAGYTVHWLTARFQGPTELRRSYPSYARVDANGAPVGPSFSPTAVTNGLIWDTRLSSVGALADRDVLTWNEGDRAFVQLRPVTGPPLAPVAVIAAGPIICGPSRCALTGARALVDASGATTPIAGAARGLLAFAAVTDRHLVTLTDTRNPDTGAPDVGIVRATFDGATVDAMPLRFSTFGASRVPLGIASDGTGVLAVYEVTVGSGRYGPGIYAQRVETAMGVRGGNGDILALPVPAPGVPRGMQVIWDGAQFFAGIQERVAGETLRLHYHRVAADGTPVAGGARQLAMLEGARLENPQLVGGHGHRAIVGLWGGRGRLAPLQADGALAPGSAGFVARNPPRAEVPAIASDGENIVAACSLELIAQQPMTPAHVIVAARPPLAAGAVAGRATTVAVPGTLLRTGTGYVGVGPTSLVHVGATGDPRVVNVAQTNGSLSPRAVALGDTILADLADTARVVRLDLEGRALDPNPIAAGASAWRALGTDGTVALVAYQSVTGLFGAVRMNARGDVLDAEPWRITGDAANAFRATGVAGGGGVWTVGAIGAVAQFDATGNFLRRVALAGETGPTRVVWTGREFVLLVARTARLLPTATTRSLRAYAISTAGALSGPIEAGPLDGVEIATELAVTALRDGTVALNAIAFDPATAATRCDLRFIAPGSMPPADAATPLDAGASTDVAAPEDAASSTDVVVPADTVTVTDVVAPQDAPVATDAPSSSDVPSAADAGPPAPPPDDGGCTVRARGRSSGSTWAWVAALALALRLRRRARRRDSALHRERAANASVRPTGGSRRTLRGGRWWCRARAGRTTAIGRGASFRGRNTAATRGAPTMRRA